MEAEAALVGFMAKLQAPTCELPKKPQPAGSCREVLSCAGRCHRVMRLTRAIGAACGEGATSKYAASILGMRTGPTKPGIAPRSPQEMQDREAVLRESGRPCIKGRLNFRFQLHGHL